MPAWPFFPPFIFNFNLKTFFGEISTKWWIYFHCCGEKEIMKNEIRRNEKMSSSIIERLEFTASGTQPVVLS